MLRLMLVIFLSSNTVCTCSSLQTGTGEASDAADAAELHCETRPASWIALLRPHLLLPV